MKNVLPDNGDRHSEIDRRQFSFFTAIYSKNFKPFIFTVSQRLINNPKD